MTRKDIEINKDVLNRFVIFEKKERLAHAYLFVGPTHIGKGATALAVAKFLNCEDRRDASPYCCNRCPACLNIHSGNHPDVHILIGRPDQSIKIDEIRQLLSRIRLQPFMAEKKVCIIKEAEHLTVEAANALLKTLEEPSPGSLLILTTAIPERIPETIRSRCRRMSFVPLSQRELAARLIQYYDKDKRQAHFLAYFAEGCPGKARALRKSGIDKTKDEIIGRFILGGERESLIKEVLSDKIKTKEFLDILLSWVRDCLLIKSGVEEIRLIHADHIREIQVFQQRFSFKELVNLYEEIVQTCRLCVENLNVKIPLMLIAQMI